MLLLSISSLADRDVFQRDDAAWFLVRREFEVVQAVVVQDEPPPLPTFVAATLFPQPALFVGVEEGVHEVVAVIFGDLEGLGFYAFVQTLRANALTVITFEN